jgi:hypothetical protein
LLGISFYRGTHQFQWMIVIDMKTNQNHHQNSCGTS